MKKLFAAVLFIAGMGFWACQKEYSYETETDTASTGAWEFKDSANTTYAGNSGSFGIDDSTNPASAIMDYSGVTADGRGILSISIIFPSVVAATGTYTSAAGQASFSYAFPDGRLYVANPGISLRGENMSIVITQISDTSVTGTFTGRALDKGDTVRIVKDGKFTFKKRGAATTPTPIASTGTLGTSTDTCTGAVLAGTYKRGLAMTSANTVTVTANVTATGTYTITSDTIKGIYFRGSAAFNTTGAQSVVIPALGTPTDSGTVRFRLRYGTSSCTFQVKIDTGTIAPVTVIPPVGDYFPLTTNSNWSYNTYDSGSTVITDTAYTRSTGVVSTLSGNSFNQFVTRGGSSPDTTAYFRKAAGIYYTSINLSDYGATGTGQAIFLKDNVAQGSTWTDQFNATVNGISSTVKFDNVILAKGVSATVGGFSSTDVIKVRTTISLGSAPFFLPFIVLENWYAKGLGSMYQKTSDPSAAATTIETTIRRYQVF